MVNISMLLQMLSGVLFIGEYGVFVYLLNPKWQ